MFGPTGNLRLSIIKQYLHLWWSQEQSFSLRCFITPMTPPGSLIGTLARLSFGDCSTLKFRRSTKMKISFDSRQPQVSNETKLGMTPCREGGLIPNDSKLDNILLREKNATTIFQVVPWAVTSLFVNGNGFVGYLQTSPVQTYHNYVNFMQLRAGIRFCACSANV